MSIKRVYLCILFILVFSINSYSSESIYGYENRDNNIDENSNHTSFNYALKVGTLGVGVDLSTSLNEWMSLRFNANGLRYTTDDESRYNSMISTDKTYDLQTIGLLLDYHLLQLRVTTGIYMNDNLIIDIATPTSRSGLFFNGVNYDVSSITRVEQTISFNKVSPYLGIGWGNNTKKEGWNISLDIGLMYHGTPSLDLDITFNPLLSKAKADEILKNAEAEKKVQEDDLSDFPFYPVVMVGFSYSF
jgi:hypothetical protein